MLNETAAPRGLARGLRRWRHGGRQAPYYLMMPSLVILAVIVFIPIVAALYISLTSLNQYTIGDWIHAPFVGLANYIAGLNPHGPLGGSLVNSIRASIEFSLVVTVVSTPIGIGAGLLLNGEVRGRGMFRALMLLPYVIPSYVSALVWRLMFMQQWGVIDRLLALLHLGRADTLWLLGPNSFWAMVIADSWLSWPFMYMMTLAGLQTIPAEVYDSARVDGARAWSTFRHITLPLLMPSLSLGILFSTIGHFNNFTLPYVMFGAHPPDPVNVLPLNVYTNSFELVNFGFGASMAVIALLIMIIPAAIYLRATRLTSIEE